MAIRYVSFIAPVSLGSIGSVVAWSEDKHGRDVAILEKGNWMILTILVDSRVRRRVPMTNVAYISEDEGESKYDGDGKIRAPKEPAVPK